MQTVLIQIENSKAFHILQDLEEFKVLKIIDENFNNKKVKFSDKYKGVFSKDDAKKFDEHIQVARNEWKNI